MKNKMNRRSFIKKGSTLTAAATLSAYLPARLVYGMSDVPDVAVVNGSGVFANTLKAVEALGGIEKIVAKGSKVGLLINSSFDRKGAYVDPDVPLAVISLCLDAGAKDIVCLQKVADEYWLRTEKGRAMEKELKKVSQIESNNFPAVFNEEDWMEQEITNGVSLKSAQIIKAIHEVDVFINIAIAKHHQGTIYTGALKNMMGVCTRETNVYYHLGSGERNNPEFLGQCIADINLVRKPDLTLVDAHEVLATNGPGGPGVVLNPGQLVAGKDIVAVDSYAASILEHEKGDVISISRAHDHGIGNMNFEELTVKEYQV